MPSMSPAVAGSGTMAAAGGTGSSMSTPSAGSGSLSASPGVNGDGLYCSESLACSDTSVICTDADGIAMAVAGTGTMVAA